MTSEEKRSLIKQYIQAYNSYDVSTLLELLHPEVQFTNISNGQLNAKASGLDEFKTIAEQSKSFFVSRRQNITSYTFNGDNAIVNVKYEAIVAKDIPNGPKAGEQMAIDGKTEFNFCDGKLKQITDYS